MDSKGYLESYGWVEGEALRAGGLKRPILVKHKQDKKGLGSAPGHDDSEAWWERLFDGHLKNLNVSDSKNGDITFEQKEVVASGVSKKDSPLYKWFVQGEGLKGTIEINKESKLKRSLEEDDEQKKSRKKLKKSTKDKSHSKEKSKERSKEKSKKKEKSKSKGKSKKDSSKNKEESKLKRKKSETGKSDEKKAKTTKKKHKSKKESSNKKMKDKDSKKSRAHTKK